MIIIDEYLSSYSVDSYASADIPPVHLVILRDVEIWQPPQSHSDLLSIL